MLAKPLKAPGQFGLVLALTLYQAHLRSADVTPMSFLGSFGRVLCPAFLNVSPTTRVAKVKCCCAVAGLFLWALLACSLVAQNAPSTPTAVQPALPATPPPLIPPAAPAVAGPLQLPPGIGREARPVGKLNIGGIFSATGAGAGKSRARRRFRARGREQWPDIFSKDIGMVAVLCSGWRLQHSDAGDAVLAHRESY